MMHTPPPDSTRKRPAPLTVAPGEPVAYTRIRALQWADYHGWITYLFVVNATDDVSSWRFAWLPAGVTPTDLPPGENPPELLAAEVLPFCYGLALAHGWAMDLAYRDGLPR